MTSDTTGKKKRQTGLGKGLDALFPGIGTEDENVFSGEYFDCPVDRIRPNPYQPRREFSEEELAELAESVQTHGVLQPILVRAAEDGVYEVITGERRLRAAKMARLESIPVVVRNIKNKEMLEFSIIENIQRENLNAMEEAEAYQRLLDEFGLTQENVSERVGKSRSSVANFLRLNHLSDEVKQALREEGISMGHARALLGSDSAAVQRKAMQMVINGGLSVRETEKLVKRLNNRIGQSPAPAPPTSEDIHFADIQEDLGRFFGTRVNIRRRGKKGKLEIEFYGNEDFDRILSLIKSA